MYCVSIPFPTTPSAPVTGTETARSMYLTPSVRSVTPCFRSTPAEPMRSLIGKLSSIFAGSRLGSANALTRTSRGGSRLTNRSSSIDPK